YLGIAPALADARGKLDTLRKEYESVKPYSTVPVIRELEKDKRRVTHLQRRGNYLEHGGVVSPGVPSAIHPLATQAVADRLQFAQWLVDPMNPLTGRVTVNRLWESLFGLGLVRTSEEFGSQGELPSHPELLDWLATELVSSRWNLKHMLKLMTTSAAYRQTSKVSPELLQRDPDNVLLARGPRFRLSAEMVRDQALFVSGLLSSKMYGPPVKPPQPKMGLNAAFGSGTDWETSAGEDQHRRALYTTWRRSNPYPSMATFDAPNREVCTVRRDRSNTPLQALVTLNDPVYIEAAQGLARRMIKAGADARERALHGFRLCVSRAPNEKELSTLLSVFDRALKRFQDAPAKAGALLMQPATDKAEDPGTAEVAAWTVVGSVLLNLDETLMKR
ncbi:MAG: DUF1553 domain-containing protein, partial [Verrucomicrobia bacterium]|nr:DUF1553 domain-containing protein [Verrucomicrobiota bacterium]